MPLPSSMTSFTAGTTIQSAQVNTNFNNLYTNLVNYVMYIDVARTVTVSHSYTAAQLFADGTVAAPGISNANETGSGFYRIGVSHWGFALAGTQLVDYAATTLTLSGDLKFTDATYDIGKTGATRPRDLFLSRNLTIGGTTSFGGNVVSNVLFTDNTYDIGASGATRPRNLYLAGNLVVGGTSTFTGNVVSDVLFTDATYDIGKSGATRPRDGFFSRNVTIGGTLGVTGVTTLGNVVFTGNPSTLKSGGANGIEAISSTSALLFQAYDNGPFFLNGVGTTTSAALGDLLISKANAIRTVNNAGTDTFALISYGATDKVLIDPGAKGATCGYNLKLTGGAFDGVAYTMLYVLGGLGTGGSGLGTSAVNVYSQSSITTAKEIATPAGAVYVYVYGSDGTGSNQFLDIVVTTYGTSAPTVLSSTTIAGTPTARTYTNPVAGSLNLAMASGTYNTRALWWYLERR